MAPLDADASAPYQTITRIGRGGMGEVMLAARRAGGVTKLAVLKCLWPELAEDPDFVAMFLDEARLGARLSHPNVVQMYGVARHEGRLAMALEYLEGQPLTTILTRAGADLGFGERLGIVAHVLAGLEHAHNLTDFDGSPLGVVHRDVSPHNVIVTYDGHVKLIDFGVAKTLASSHQTRPGGLKGKLAYLAPEALRGDPIDRRTDVFSVGVMLWELLADRRFWGSSDDAVIAGRLSMGEPAPELPGDREIPPGLRAVCRRALALDPDRRPQSAAELASDLERFGPLTSEAHARHLGFTVARAFEAERAERRALVEFHLRGAATERVGGADYESVELELPDARPEPEVEGDSTMSIVTTIHGAPSFDVPLDAFDVPVDTFDVSVETRPGAPVDVSVEARPAAPIDDLEVELELLPEPAPGFTTSDFVTPAPARDVTPPPLTPPALTPPTLTPPAIVRHGWSRTAIVATVAAAVAAIVTGSRVGREHAPATPALVVPAATATAVAPPPPAVEPPSPRGAAPASAARTETAEHRERRLRPRRPHLDLLSDDVLDLDGSPLPPSPGSGVSHRSND